MPCVLFSSMSAFINLLFDATVDDALSEGKLKKEKESAMRKGLLTAALHHFNLNKFVYLRIKR